MRSVFIRIFAIIPGLGLLINGLTWVGQPEQAAESLGMPLLEGLGRSTQIGDFSAFFLTGALLTFAGAVLKQSQYFYSVALLVGMAAIMRTYAALVHGAEFATQFIVIELILSLWLLAGGYFVGKLPDN